jgi:hypothetical protein
MSGLLPNIPKMKAIILFGILGPVSAQLTISTREVSNCPLTASIPTATATSAATPTAKGRSFGRCGAGKRPASLLEALPSIRNASAGSAQQTGPARSIRTHFHIVNTEQNQSVYDDSYYLQQLVVMNDAYEPTGFQFDLASFQRYIDNTSAHGENDTVMDNVREKYHNGSYAELNLIFLSDWRPYQVNGKPYNSTLYGICPYPRLGATPLQKRSDGCIINQITLPGSKTNPQVSGGKTAVHEIGHWLGLAHPWGDEDDYGACIRSAGIFDVPIMERAVEGCPNMLDSCPLPTQLPAGPDPIHNYMGYTDDCCMYEFTIGQITDMANVYSSVRLTQ